MRFEKTITVKAPLQEVWDLFWDHERLFPCIKGFKKAEVIEPKSRYSVYVMEKVGPFKVNFAIDAEVIEIEELHHAQLKAAGKDSKIAATFRQHGELKLRKVSDEETELQFATDVSIFGKLATLGRWVIKRKADEGMEYFVRSIKARLEKDGGI